MERREQFHFYRIMKRYYLLAVSLLAAYNLFAKTPDNVEAVDLGLPSGNLWASCNVGASKPEEYGNYYAWGEVETKTIYIEDNYKYYNDSFNTFTFIDTQIDHSIYDIASLTYGNGWCIPSPYDYEELINYCEWEWTNLNGVCGYKIIGKNNNSIFLPAAGFKYQKLTGYEQKEGHYWESFYYEKDNEHAQSIIFKANAKPYSIFGMHALSSKCCGLVIRAVQRNVVMSDPNNYEYEDYIVMNATIVPSSATVTSRDFQFEVSDPTILTIEKVYTYGSTHSVDGITVEAKVIKNGFCVVTAKLIGRDTSISWEINATNCNAIEGVSTNCTETKKYTLDGRQTTSEENGLYLHKKGNQFNKVYISNKR